MRRTILGPMVLLTAGCAASPAPLELGQLVQPGVDPQTEAAAVERGLAAAGYARTERVAADGVVALSFSRSDGRRAVRVVTERGLVATLDSHEPDGVRTRHGDVRLVPLPVDDLDGDGQPELVVARREDENDCLAILRVGAEGRVSVAANDAEELAPGACISTLRDLDGDGRLEALVPISWPELALGDEVPAVDAVLMPREGSWRADTPPSDHQRAENTRRQQSLEGARARLDVPVALRAAVELAALAHLAGAAPGAEVHVFDEALAGLVLGGRELVAVQNARRVIAAGWRGEATRDTPAPRSDGSQEENPR